VRERGAEPCALLTGLPRGGTTLVCELLNRLPDVLALDEPMDPNRLVAEATSKDGRTIDPGLLLSGIERFAAAQRRSILERGVALTLHVEGRVLGARVSDERGEDGARVAMGVRSEIPVEHPASSDFMLVIKHPVAFTALLEILRGHFDVFAVVRNPLAVLASWESVPFAQREGRLGLRAIFAPALCERLAATADRLERQLILLDWFFERYATLLPGERIIRYEDVVRTRGGALVPIAAGARALGVPLQGRNLASVYDRAHMRKAGERLLERDGAWLSFYSRDEVQGLVPAA